MLKCVFHKRVKNMKSVGQVAIATTLATSKIENSLFAVILSIRLCEYNLLK